MSVQSTEAAVIKDIDSILAKLGTDIDKVRTISDKVNEAIQSIDHNFFIAMVDKLPAVAPIVQIVDDLVQGLDALVDALDDVADGLASNSAKPLPQAATGAGGSVAAS